MKMIITSECVDCKHSKIEEISKSNVKVHCLIKDKVYFWGQCIPCELKEKERDKENKRMKKCARFEKVSYKQFKDDWIKTFGEKNENDIKEIYNNISLPKRSTIGSAGYDFATPCNITLAPKQAIKIPTGIRVNIDTGWVLKLFPRSSLGFKYHLMLDNTVGIIDEDYYYSDNEGHIMAKITNCSNEGKLMQLKAGDRFMQGIFTEYGITYDDNVIAIRNGGMGSTGK